MSGRIDSLTGLRAVAVTMVIVHHAENLVLGGYAGPLLPLQLMANGGLGVQIFFILSGFLIAGILIDEYGAAGKIDIKAFYIRRALRIWPAFYAYIAVIGAITLYGSLQITGLEFAAAGLHIWNYGQLFGLLSTTDGAWYLAHFWSLSLEEQFYWIWPALLLLAFRLKSMWPVVALILAMPAIRVLSYFMFPSTRGQLMMMTHTGLDQILIGCYAAYRRNFQWPPMLKAMLTPIALLLLIVPTVMSNQFGGAWSVTIGPTIQGAAIGLLIIALSDFPRWWLSRALSTRPAVFLGTISFSLYLWQQLFLGKNSPAGLSIGLSVIASIAAGAASYALIERPFLLLKKRLSR